MTNGSLIKKNIASVNIIDTALHKFKAHYIYGCEKKFRAQIILLEPFLIQIGHVPKESMPHHTVCRMNTRRLFATSKSLHTTVCKDIQGQIA